MTIPCRTVCTGNICRSPMAGLMLANAATGAGLDVPADCAGTTAWTTGLFGARRSERQNP